MCVETPGVPPLLDAAQRGPNDRIKPEELQPFAPGSVGWCVHPPEPDPDGLTPIVLVCHERYGVVRHTIELAEKFAKSGFLAVTPDFYADMVLTGEEEVLPGVDDATVLRHLDAAIAHARTLPGAGPESPVAVVGICRSGSYGIVASAQRSDVDAVVMLYGGAQPREYRTGDLRGTPYRELVRSGKAPVLGLWGEADHTMSVDDVRLLRDVLEDAFRSYDFVIYPELPHGWLNDTMPGRFRADAAAETMGTIVDWLKEKLVPGAPRRRVSWSFRASIATDYDFAANSRLE